MLGEEPVGAFGGGAAGGVGVGGDDWRGVEGGEEPGLGLGEGGAQGGHADVPALTCRGDGEGVEGAFDEDGNSATVRAADGRPRRARRPCGTGGWSGC